MMPISVLQFLLLIYLDSCVHSSPFRPKGDDIIIIGGSSDSSGGGGPIVMDDGKKGKGSTIIIIPPPPLPSTPHRDPFMDSMFGAASYEAMPIMSPAPPPMNAQHMHPHVPPPPPPPPHYAPNMMSSPHNFYGGEPMNTPPTAKKKKKKKKKATTTTTTTTTTTSTTPAPAISPFYGQALPYPDAPPAFENFYFTSENSNNGHGSGQSSYNMPAMMKMMQQYTSGSDTGAAAPDMGAAMGSGSDKGTHSNTFEFPKFPQIIIKVPAPIVNVPQPIVNVPAAIVNVSVPEIRIPQTQVTVPAPIVNVPIPVVNVPAANVSVTVPQIDVPPAIVNVPKKLVLKKEFRISSDHKSMSGSRSIRPMKAMNGHTTMADSEHIEFDDEVDDERYSQAGSSHRQDQRFADLNYAKHASQQQQHHHQSPDYGGVVYAPIRTTSSSASPPASRSHPAATKYRNSRPQTRTREKQPPVDHSSFQYQNFNQQSQQAYDRPTMVHMDSPDSRYQQYPQQYHQQHHQANNIPSDQTPIQHHFAQTPPLQYYPPASPLERPPVKVLHGRANKHQQQQQPRPRPQTTISYQNTQFDDDVPQSDGNSDPRDQNQEEEQPRPPDPTKSSAVTEEAVIEFLRKNNMKPMIKNANLQVMRDDKKQPNIIFEKTESPVSESVSYESDQTIFDDRNPNNADADPRNNQRNNDGIVFEEIPSHEFTAVTESEASVSDNMMYEDQKDSLAYSTASEPIVHQSNPNPSPQLEATPAQPSDSVRRSGKRSVIRRRKKIQSHQSDQSNQATAAGTQSVATSSDSSSIGQDSSEIRNQEEAASMPI